MEEKTLDELKKEQTVYRIFLFVVGMFTVISLSIALISFLESRREKNYFTESEQVTAVVNEIVLSEDAHSSRAKIHAHSYTGYVDYTFRGVSYTHVYAGQCSKNLRPGQRVTVYVSLSSPGTAAFDKNRGDWLFWIAVVVGAFGAAMLVVFILLIRRVIPISAKVKSHPDYVKPKFFQLDKDKPFI